MKMWHWIVALIVLYEAVVGAGEVYAYAVPGSVGTTSLPSLGSLVGTSIPSSNVYLTEAIIDLGAAALLYFAVLHHHLF
jgi:hypothetical protein